MSKKTIFLSHISEEGELGTLFKDRLEKDFLSLIDVFVSSDARSIPPGDAWLKAVDNNLDKAAALIVLASPASVVRPWITFETGAGWAKKVPTMLICHSGMAPGALPLPLGQLQAFKVEEVARLKAMYGVIASVLGSATPDVDLAPFLKDVAAFQSAYTEERDVLSALRSLHSESRDLVHYLRKVGVGSPHTITNMPEALFRRVEDTFRSLQTRGLVQYNFAFQGMSFGESGGGSFGNLVLTLTPPVAKALHRSEFN